MKLYIQDHNEQRELEDITIDSFFIRFEDGKEVSLDCVDGKYLVAYGSEIEYHTVLWTALLRLSELVQGKK